MLYTHVAAAILGASVAAWGAWQVQDARLGGAVLEAQQERTKAQNALTQEKQDGKDRLLRARAASIETYLRMENTKNAAITQANLRADANRDASRRAHLELDGLRGELASVPARLATATREACAQYAGTATKLLGQCTSRLTELAQSADGHANDARTLSEAWPTQPTPSQPDAGTNQRIKFNELR